MNIPVARNHESGNLEIGVPLLGNRLFCAWLRVHFYGDICQGLAASAVRSSLYEYSCRNYDSVYTKANLKSDFRTPDRWWISLRIIHGHFWKICFHGHRSCQTEFANRWNQNRRPRKWPYICQGTYDGAFTLKTVDRCKITFTSVYCWLLNIL